jgi:uncharacterized protein (DUF305 family)
MKLVILFSGCILMVSCHDSQPSTTAPVVDTVAVHPLRQESQSTLPAGRIASEDMLQDMRGMMAEIKKLQLTGDPDIDYAMMMKLHHESAIRMGKRELDAGADKELKTMAEGMMRSQQKEVEDLQAFLTHHTPDGHSSFGQDMMRLMEDSKLENLPMKSDPDQDFAALMARHHQDAIDMSNEFLKTAKESAMIIFAKKMIGRQKGEINRLDAWTAAHASKGS